MSEEDMTPEEKTAKMKAFCMEVIEHGTPWILIVPKHATVTKADGSTEEAAMANLEPFVMTMGTQPGPEAAEFWKALLEGVADGMQRYANPIHPN